MQAIRALVQRHRQGYRVGVTAVCSSHPLVIEAAFRQALARDRPVVLIEATSNQVNQDGGYTGMVPAQFRDMVHAIAGRVGFPLDRLVLGGDHLGPNAWSTLPAAQAMAKAAVMVAEYVRAGFGKIHLDCSMSCADDPVPLPEATIAERAAWLCGAAEAACTGPEATRPVYVIGTEVPVPGGAAEQLEGLAVTSPLAARATIDLHRELFMRAGLAAAWDRVIALVVQPGVEFDHDAVLNYRPAAAAGLRGAIAAGHLVFEAHSTDYQLPSALAALVRDHFAILKVGPSATYALREALWALDAIEAELIQPSARAGLRAVTIARMHAQPQHWQRYYHAAGPALDLQLQYSLSDRIRYYWPDAAVQAAQATLFANLRATPIPPPLISQHLPLAHAALRAGQITSDPADLCIAQICATLDAYDGACHQDA